MTVATLEIRGLGSPVGDPFVRAAIATSETIEFLRTSSSCGAIVDNRKTITSVRDQVTAMRSFMDEPAIYAPAEGAAILDAMNRQPTAIKGAALRRRD